MSRSRGKVGASRPTPKDYPGDLELRRAVPADAAGIVRTFGQAMPSSVLPLSIFGVRDATRFTAATIAATSRGGDSAFSVATTDGGVVGFLQLRLGFTAVVVNQLHVHPRFQGRGIGRGLLRQATDPHPSTDLLVDVSDDSAGAIRFYERAGFTPEGTVHVWLTTPIPPHSAAPFVLRGLPQADATHAAFGLSHLQAETRTGVYDIGRLGDRWFRLSEAVALGDEGLLSALEALDPTREVLAIIPLASDRSVGRQVLTSLRYAARSEVVQAHLAR